jgi:hypothetical protein
MANPGHHAIVRTMPPMLHDRKSIIKLQGNSGLNVASPRQ